MYAYAYHPSTVYRQCTLLTTRLDHNAGAECVASSQTWSLIHLLAPADRHPHQCQACNFCPCCCCAGVHIYGSFPSTKGHCASCFFSRPWQNLHQIAATRWRDAAVLAAGTWLCSRTWRNRICSHCASNSATPRWGRVCPQKSYKIRPLPRVRVAIAQQRPSDPRPSL